MTTDIPTVDAANFDLEYHDAVKDPNDPVMQAVEAEVPGRYKGKKVEDLIQMHVNLEKVLQRQGRELGQARKTIDMQSEALANVIKGTTPPKVLPEVTPQPLTAEAILNDPEKAVNTAIASNPAVTTVNQRLNQLEKKLGQDTFEEKYPTIQQEVQNPEFQEWVMGSKTRSKLLVALHNYDFDAGGDLMELWNDHKEAQTAAQAARDQKTKAATTVKGGSSEPAGKPIYSRAKLAELQVRVAKNDPAAVAKWNDPEFQREYIAAYQEGRVK